MLLYAMQGKSPGIAISENIADDEREVCRSGDWSGRSDVPLVWQGIYCNRHTLNDDEQVRRFTGAYGIDVQSMSANVLL